MNDSDQPVRQWLDSHPATATYIAAVVTLLLLLQIIETMHLL